MKKPGIFCIALFFASFLYSQTTYDPDISIISSNCKTDDPATLEMIYCTEDEIVDLAISLMEEECIPSREPEGNDHFFYTIYLSVSSRGKVDFVEVKNPRAPDCGKNLEEILWTALKKWKFEAAIDNDKKVAYRKMIRIAPDWKEQRVRRSAMDDGFAETDAIFKVVEDMPRFPGCEDKLIGQQERQSCSQQKMLQFVYGNLVYPPEARKERLEGSVIVQFVIDKNGIVNEEKIVRDIGLGCGEAVLAVIAKMRNEEVSWIAGRQRGKAVNVQFTLPISFKLE